MRCQCPFDERELDGEGERSIQEKSFTKRMVLFGGSPTDKTIRRTQETEVVQDDLRVVDAIGCIMDVKDQLEGFSPLNGPTCCEPPGAASIKRLGR